MKRCRADSFTLFLPVQSRVPEVEWSENCLSCPKPSVSWPPTANIPLKIPPPQIAMTNLKLKAIS